MSTSAQQISGLRRTDLQRHDLSVPGHEAIQNHAAELATYIVEKGKPLITVVE